MYVCFIYISYMKINEHGLSVVLKNKIEIVKFLHTFYVIFTRRLALSHLYLPNSSLQ